MNKRFTLSFLALALLVSTVPTRSNATSCPAIEALQVTTFVAALSVATVAFYGMGLLLYDEIFNERSHDEWQAIDAQILCNNLESAYRGKEISQLIFELQKKDGKQVPIFSQPCHVIKFKLLNTHNKLRTLQKKLNTLPIKAFGCIHDQKRTFAQITTTVELLEETLKRVIASAEYKTEQVRA